MKKADLKKAIKPLVKECIHEVLLEEGLLSNIVSEVAIGMQGKVLIEAQQQSIVPQTTKNKSRQTNNVQKLKQQKTRMLDAIGKDAYNGVDLFEGTTPAPTEHGQTAGTVDLGTPSDSGVDISSLVGGASQIWNAMK